MAPQRRHPGPLNRLLCSRRSLLKTNTKKRRGDVEHFCSKNVPRLIRASGARTAPLWLCIQLSHPRYQWRQNFATYDSMTQVGLSFVAAVVSETRVTATGRAGNSCMCKSWEFVSYNPSQKLRVVSCLAFRDMRQRFVCCQSVRFRCRSVEWFRPLPLQSGGRSAEVAC